MSGGGGDDGGDGEEEVEEEVEVEECVDASGNVVPEGTPGAVKVKRKQKRRRKKRRTHNLPDKDTEFQVRIKILEGRQLPGGNINPTVRLTVGSELKQTQVKKSTNRPYFDETFFFNFTMRPNEMFDTIATFEVFNSKSVLSDSLIGSFQCDCGTFYYEDGHCLIRKWLLLSAPSDDDGKDEEGEGESQRSSESGGPAGYLKITGMVLGPGDEIPSKAKTGAKGDEGEDIESNLLRPPGTTLRPATFLVKVYRAEDIPQMDTGLFEGVKKLFSKGPPKELVDPFCRFTFAGQEAETKIMHSNDHPEFNQELRVAFKFPSMCESLKIQMYDWDRLGNNDCIGTSIINLSAISGTGDDGFLPCFGPCFVNFYGSLREYSDLPDQYDDLNKGRGVGVAYRGRALVEIDTKFGDHADTKCQDILAQELIRVQTYLRRRKFKLFASFMSANMICETDGPIEFEVSIGNYGNKLDNSCEPQSSSTPPYNAVFDGNAYYYLPWNETKPCCVVESHWEDIYFRLEPINFILKIIDRLETNIKDVEVRIDAKLQAAEIAAGLIALLDQLIADCSQPLPVFDSTVNGVNELDLKNQEIRLSEMALLVEEATVLRESATDVNEAMDGVHGYLLRLKELVIEPQNSMPDVIIWMISGSTRIAYTRIPAYDIMYSSNPAAKGRNCAKLQNFLLKYPGKKATDFDKHPEIPAQVRAILWLGLQKDQDDFNQGTEHGGEASVFAECYENNIFNPLTRNWTTKLMPRPSFSDSQGDIRLMKESFVPPEGWKWDDPPDGDWFVDPELSATNDADAGHKVFVEDAFENQSRYTPAGNWGTNSDVPYTDVRGDPMDHRDELPLPEGWKWTTDWTVDLNRACDEEGFEYCIDASLGGWGAVMKNYHLSRRRRWVRTRVMEADPKKIEQKKKEEVKAGEGWEYAVVFGEKFHLKERKKDMVRRRRWHRKMVNTIPGAPPLFAVPDEDDDKEPHNIMPRMFLSFDEPHEWQLRAYIYQARDVLGLDSEGTSDPYAQICFEDQSQNTQVIKETLCPDWDETLIFDDINIFGNPKMLTESPPDIVIEVYDKDKVGKDEFLGRCHCKPVVKLPGVKAPAVQLMWYTITRGEREAGEVLAAFELFLKEDADLPLPPPQKKNNTLSVPTGIRPVLVRTGIEILCWGVRNMKKYQLASVTSPSVAFEIGGKIVESNVIKNTKKNPNFKTTTFFLDLYLPKKDLYMPPLNIRVRDHRTFGRKPVVGRHVLKAPDKSEPLSAAEAAPEPIRPDEPVSQQSVIVDVEARKKKADALDEVDLDWWSKYFATIGEYEKCGTYLTKGYKKITFYPDELENFFGNFGDFVQTFELTRGKEDDEEDDNVVGEFKGLVKVYPLPSDPKVELPPKYFAKIPDSNPVECIVRVYVIRGIDLAPKDPNGKADPFIEVILGKKKISDKDKYIPNTIQPIFGRMFEIKAKIPIQKDLTIKIMDYDLLSKNDLIGQTTIDLENRYYSKFRALCGLSPQYFSTGQFQWRDSKSPMEILESQADPKWLSDTQVVVNSKLHKLEDFESQEDGANPHLGNTKQRLALHVLNTMTLVPEHIETRSLKNPLTPGADQGQLQMFVDVFPVGKQPPGPPMNILPRQGMPYTLRAIIWNTGDVKLDETSITGEQMSDIYVKAWMDGMENDKAKTDIHYRSLDGTGMFNWRLIFPFDYMKNERVCVVKKKAHFWSLDKTEERLPPKFSVQIWDNDTFSRDDFLGTVEMVLHKVPRPKKTQSSCTLDMLDPTKMSDDDYVDLFKQKELKGWWPCYLETPDGTRELTGKVEMTLEILTENEVQERPAGSGQDEPNMNPVLEPPKRPETSFFWFTSPWKTFKFIIWRKFKWYFIIGILLLLLIAFVVLLLWSIPGATIRKLFGA